MYVLPLHVEELLKLGFSRDPLARMRTLHPRYFDFFDCRHAVVVETDRVREARAIETALKRRLRDHRAAAPPEIAASAGGDSEWFRGASTLIDTEIAALEDGGYRVHRGSSGWLRDQVLARSAELFESSAQALEQIGLARSEDELRARAVLSTRLRDALDALVAFEIDVANAVPAQVDDWYRAGANTTDP